MELSRFEYNPGIWKGPTVYFVIWWRPWNLGLSTVQHPPKCHPTQWRCGADWAGCPDTHQSTWAQAAFSCSMVQPSQGSPSVSLSTQTLMWLCLQPKQSLSLPLPWFRRWSNSTRSQTAQTPVLLNCKNFLHVVEPGGQGQECLVISACLPLPNCVFIRFLCWPSSRLQQQSKDALQTSNLAIRWFATLFQQLAIWCFKILQWDDVPHLDFCWALLSHKFPTDWESDVYKWRLDTKAPFFTTSLAQIIAPRLGSKALE